MIYLDSMGHLYSDSSLQELYDFAVKRLGLRPEWNHFSLYFPHFDLMGSKIKTALSMGAVYINLKDNAQRVLEVERYRKVRLLYRDYLKQFKAEEVCYPCKGMHGQKILRLNFEKLGIK